ncbi:hypothetical protein OIE62_01290 [Streptomyces scopuliridis]|uniref:Uncharacterized protein n=1 Tax=Streptomyces scopuliridis TaxID=452529 RepID=A0ACD4ZWI9_9ACTN|nr:hypothetical protein [Streptomyces scopuliridis]WSB38238.1 hypothetical protein OG949_39055 [Streptomyces scopuliridis]WSC02671.1 hypothetical protein OG835_40545 [Streptomyces scopuliridis]WSC03797.1 hypothetical protein OIE62_01290 [Streptomyces scopuliridis]
MNSSNAPRFDLLLHAYGRAVDTPGHLDALTAEDPAARDAAVYHLNSAIVHQGTPWTATGSATEYVSAIIRRDAVADEATLVELLRFLGEVAESAAIGAEDDIESLARPAGRDIEAEVAAMLESDDVDAVDGDGGDEDDDEDAAYLLYEDEVRADALFARAVLGCRAALPGIVAAAAYAGAHPDERVRAEAAETLAAATAALPSDTSPR